MKKKVETELLNMFSIYQILFMNCKEKKLLNDSKQINTVSTVTKKILIFIRECN